MDSYYNDFACGTTTTEVKYASEVIFSTDIAYLALTGELWGVFGEDSGGNWPCNNGTAVYWDGPLDISSNDTDQILLKFSSLAAEGGIVHKQYCGCR